jgi:hypothetical protein
MTDIIVTTPKSEMKNSAREASDAIAAGGGEYFRRFPIKHYPKLLTVGDRVYYVEDGYIRGFAVVSDIRNILSTIRCDTTGKPWRPGVYVFMQADSWQWVHPIIMRGFQGFRYAGRPSESTMSLSDKIVVPVKIVGGWKDEKPLVENGVVLLKLENYSNHSHSKQDYQDYLRRHGMRVDAKRRVKT